MPNNRLPAIFRAIAAACTDVTGIASAYPLPAELPTELTIMVMGSSIDLGRTGNEQQWLISARALMAIPMTGEIGAAAEAADTAVPELADAFDPSSAHFRLGGLVNRCALTRVNLYQEFTIAGHRFLGHELLWDVKAHRFAGDA